jgi:single-stranded-DNA-specific exonuclease
VNLLLKSVSRWKLQEISQNFVNNLQAELDISSLTARLLVARGIKDVQEAEAFLHIEKNDYYDPFLMDGMEKAVERIKRAINDQERILIYGDYDADGVSSTSVMVYTLHKLGANFEYYIPNRFTEGYGPNENAFRWAENQGFHVIITVDTGISAVHEASIAKELGLDLVITDHHEPPPVLPDAYTIINPKKPGCPYPFKGLAGVGVAFKFAQAILGQAPEELLDIVVIGTIADLVPLQSENRLFVNKGLKVLRYTSKPGLVALLDICGLNEQDLATEHVGFAIGPRVNAVGRLGSAIPAVKLFTTSDYDEAKDLAEEIDQSNKERQAIVNQITEEAIQEVESKYPPEDHSVLVIAKEGWNPGVIGIVASRLVERYYRPTIILSIDLEKGIAKGSARSIEGFDMFENLSECRTILPHFGGHPMAAGMTLSITDVNELRIRLNQQAATQLSEEDFSPIIKVDIECNLEDISLQTIEEMHKLAPFGVGNPSPKILISNVTHNEIRKIGAEGNHLKLKVVRNNSTLDVIGFQCGHLHDHISTDSEISLVGELSINEWNGFRKPQLMLKDIAIEAWQLFDYRGVREVGKRLDALPKEKLCLVAFRKSTIEHLRIQNWQEYITYIDSPEEISVDIMNGKYLFLLDLPYEKIHLEQLLVIGAQPERTYAILFSEEEHYFNPIPSREQFKWFYAFLMKKKSFDLAKSGKELAKYKGWTFETVQFMSKVFFELEFVTIDNGIITLVENQPKRDLSDSPTYKKKSEQILLEKELCYSSFIQLKQWFMGRLKSTDLIEEAVNEDGL